jgi:hypothetical protein
MQRYSKHHPSGRTWVEMANQNVKKWENKGKVKRQQKAGKPLLYLHFMHF